MPKIAFVTGAARGLGFEVARQLGQAGHTIVLGARDPQKASKPPSCCAPKASRPRR